MLMFNVVDLQERVTTMLQMGASLDGAIQYTVEGKVVCGCISVPSDDLHVHRQRHCVRLMVK